MILSVHKQTAEIDLTRMLRKKIQRTILISEPQIMTAVCPFLPISLTDASTGSQVPQPLLLVDFQVSWGT